MKLRTFKDHAPAWKRITLCENCVDEAKKHSPFFDGVDVEQELELESDHCEMCGADKLTSRVNPLNKGAF